MINPLRLVIPFHFVYPLVGIAGLLQRHGGVLLRRQEQLQELLEEMRGAPQLLQVQERTSKRASRDFRVGHAQKTVFLLLLFAGAPPPFT